MVKIYNKKWITVTQGGADAFVSGELATNADLPNGQVMLIHKITVFFPAIPTNSSIEFQVSTEDDTSLKDASDIRSLSYKKIDAKQTTAVGVNVYESPTYMPLMPVMAGSENVYVYVDSTGTAAANEVTFCFDYELVKPTDKKLIMNIRR